MKKLTCQTSVPRYGLPTKPIQHIDDREGRVATCILSAINLGKIARLEELRLACDLAVRFLDELIDYQEYPVIAAELYTKEYRTLGIGFTGLAHYFAKNKVKYEDPKALELLHRTTEAFAFYLTESSMNLAKEKGAAPAFSRSKYADGIFPIDNYKKDVDTVAPFNLMMDWKWLRGQVKEFGLRNMTLMAQMPVESSSVVSNSTNGIERPRELLSVKKSKKGTIKMIVPGYPNLKNYYSLLWDSKDNDSMLAIIAVLQKFFDQTISANTNYNSQAFPNKEVPMSIMIRDLLQAYKLGIKTLYYHNSNDGKKDYSDELAAEKKALMPEPWLLEASDQGSVPPDDDESCAACAI